ncbi:MAG TPA: response regulator [Planctomycetota bacterium]|nr:response regulator [Planctomycetota bacterium]
MNSFSKVVLLVDDSPTVRRMLEWALRSSSLRTLQAVDGVHALEILKVQSVDLAIVDLNMPRMDGIELVRSIRADKALKNLPVILLTTEGREEDREAAIEAGVNLFLSKPAAPALLRRKAEFFLGIPGPAPGDIREATS